VAAKRMPLVNTVVCRFSRHMNLLLFHKGKCTAGQQEDVVCKISTNKLFSLFGKAQSTFDVPPVQR